MEIPVDCARWENYFDHLNEPTGLHPDLIAIYAARLSGGKMTVPVIRNLLLTALLLPTLGGSAGAETRFPRNTTKLRAQLQSEMGSGRLTSGGIDQGYLARIVALDQNGPGVNAVIEPESDALVMARNADALRRRGVDWDRCMEYQSC